MKSRIVFCALSAAVLIAGCRAQVTPANNASTAGNQANAAASAPQNSASATPAGAGAAVDRAALVGRWGMEGDCANALDFRDDGTVMPGNGAWTLAGYQLTVTNEGRPPEVQTVARNGENLTISAGGATMNMTRCP